MFPDGLQTGYVLRHVPNVAGAKRGTRLQDRNSAYISGVSFPKRYLNTVEIRRV